MNDVMLGAGPLVEVEQLQLERPVVRRLLSGTERNRVQVRMDDGTSHVLHLARCSGPSPSDPSRSEVCPNCFGRWRAESAARRHVRDGGSPVDEPLSEPVDRDRNVSEC